MNETTLKYNNSTKMIIALAILFVIAQCLFSSLFLGVSTLKTIVCLLIVLVAIQTPGYLLITRSFDRFNYFTTKVAAGFFLGFALIIPVYILSVYFRAVWILWAYALICLLVSVVYFVKDRKTLKSRLGRILSDTDGYFLVSLLIYAVLVFLYIQIEPHIKVSEYVSLYPDRVWHFGIIDAFSADFLPKVPWSASTMELKYHFFNDLFYSIIKRMTNYGPDLLLLDVSPFINCYIIPASLYSFFHELKVDRKYCFLGTVVFIPCAFFGMSPFQHLYSNMNSVGIGFACAAILFTVLARIAEEKSAFGTVFALVLLFLLTGLKSPFALIIVIAICGSLIVAVVFRLKTGPKLYWLLLSVLSVIVYLATYYCLASPDSRNFSNRDIIGVGDAFLFTNNPFFKPFIDSFETVKSSGFLGIAVVIVVMIVFLVGACIVPFTMKMIKDIDMIFIKHETVDFFYLTLYAVIIVGITANIVISIDNNMAYFGFIAEIPIVYLTIISLNDAGNAVRALTALLLVFGIVSMCVVIASDLSDKKESFAVSKIDNEQNYNEPQLFSKYEYKAMNWIKQNTDSDSVIASDRYSLYSEMYYDIDNRYFSRWFYYSAFSERNYFYEGTGYIGVRDPDERLKLYGQNRELYSSETEDRSMLAKQYGIDYMIVSKRIHPDLYLSSEGISKCYENRDIDIYQVQN